MHGVLPYMSGRRLTMPSVARTRDPASRELKSARIELRIAPSVKQVIQKAMAVTGLAAGDLAYEGARRLLEQHERMQLADADRDVFLAALANPPEPSTRLIDAIRRSRSLNA
jgi:uncharacterized protein (DUF1778 family)